MHFNAGDSWYFEERKYKMEVGISDHPSLQQGSSGAAQWGLGCISWCLHAPLHLPAAWPSTSLAAWSPLYKGSWGGAEHSPMNLSRLLGQGERHLLLREELIVIQWGKGSVVFHLQSTRANILHQVYGAVFWAAESRTRKQIAFPNTLPFCWCLLFFSWCLWSLVKVCFVKLLSYSGCGACRN